MEGYVPSKKKLIVKNRAKCLNCGDIPESDHRHDYSPCECGDLAVDGGHQYVRRTAQSFEDVKEMSEYVISWPDENGEFPDIPEDAIERIKSGS